MPMVGSEQLRGNGPGLVTRVCWLADLVLRECQRRNALVSRAAVNVLAAEALHQRPAQATARAQCAQKKQHSGSAYILALSAEQGYKNSAGESETLPALSCVCTTRPVSTAGPHTPTQEALQPNSHHRFTAVHHVRQAEQQRTYSCT